MTFGELLRRTRYWLQRERISRDLEEEMRRHVEFRAERLRNEQRPASTTGRASRSVLGTPADAAYAAARRRFGNTTTLQERSRDMWGFGRLEDFTQDVRFAFRRLTQRPAFTAGVVGVMAVGIGTTTAMFSAVDAALLRPLPFHQSEQLVVLPQVAVPAGTADTADGVTIHDARKLTRLFSSVAAYGSGALNLSDAMNPLRINAGAVTAEFFQTLGVLPLVGRIFNATDGTRGAANVAIVSYRLWQRQYGARDITALTIQLNQTPHKVIGVMPDGFNFPAASDIWVPHAIPATAGSVRVFRSVARVTALARLQTGVTVPTASATVLRLWQQRAQASSASGDDLTATVAEITTNGSVRSLQQVLVGDRRQALLVLLAATGLLLLVACGNVTSLLLAHAGLRMRELALRRALGATRVRIVRQLLTESVLLAVAGAVCGLVLAFPLLRAIGNLMPQSLMAVTSPSVDLCVLAFAMLLSLGTGVLFGIWPALGSTRHDTGEDIKSGGTRSSTNKAEGRGRRILVTGELALTTTLLIGAMLMLRSFDKLMHEDSGLQSANVGTLELALPTVGGRADRLRRIDAMLTRMQAMPGVQAAGVVNELPLSALNGIMGVGITVDGAPPAAGLKSPILRFLQASGGYFDTMRIRLLKGRRFTAADDSLAPKVAIVSERVAAHYWPGREAVGRTFRGPGESGVFTVVGVVSDLRERRLEDDPTLQLYLPVHSRTPSTLALVARGDLPPAVLLRRMQDAVRSVDASQAVFNLRMMDDVVSASVAPRRTNTFLIGTFALLALIVASLGVSAMVSFSVTTRSRELGIRSALGATGAELMRLVSRDMLWVAVFGLAIGLGTAWGLASLLDGLVYGIAVRDALTFQLVPLALLVPTAVATVVPAWRTFRVNPADVMRAE